MYVSNTVLSRSCRLSWSDMDSPQTVTHTYWHGSHSYFSFSPLSFSNGQQQQQQQRQILRHVGPVTNKRPLGADRGISGESSGSGPGPGPGPGWDQPRAAPQGVRGSPAETSSPSTPRPGLPQLHGTMPTQAQTLHTDNAVEHTSTRYQVQLEVLSSLRFHWGAVKDILLFRNQLSGLLGLGIGELYQPIIPGRSIAAAYRSLRGRWVKCLGQLSHHSGCDSHWDFN